MYMFVLMSSWGPNLLFRDMNFFLIYILDLLASLALNRYTQFTQSYRIASLNSWRFASRSLCLKFKYTWGLC